MKLTKTQQEKLWGEKGPYSEAHLTIETRILDDTVSRIFINVEIHINPFTFETIKKNEEQFKADQMIRQLLEHSEYRGLPDGYVASAYLAEFTDQSIMKEAEIALEFSKNTIIKMHKFVLEIIKLEPKGES
jgi:hypothetical protein